MIAVTMPGKLGDALYALPTCRYLYEQFGEQVDFYTSSYCEPLRNLFLYQSPIHDFIIPENYKVERFDMGAQPWYIPVEEEAYSAVYHLGFRSVPDRALHQFMALYAGIDKPLAVEYEYPVIDTDRPKFITIAPRGQTSYQTLFQEVSDKAQELGYAVLIIGGQGENSLIGGLDFTGRDMLETAAVMSKASGFVGLMSSQLVLANGFSYPKIAPHDGKSWDMRHVIYQSSNYYPVNPSADDIIRILQQHG